MSALLAVLAVSLAQFPPPRATPVTAELKCDWGPVVAYTAGERPTLVLETPAGPVTYQVSAELPVLGADKQPKGTVSGLKPQTRVRVYWVRDGGAKVLEVDLDQ
jgi:hypothetical protein